MPQVGHEDALRDGAFRRQRVEQVPRHVREIGVYAKAVFLKEQFFGRTFRVVTVDKGLVNYYTKLSDFHAQFRAIGTNYNQVVKELRSHFSEKKAMALLYKLEKCTEELAALSRRIVDLSKEMEEKWSPKSV